MTGAQNDLLNHTQRLNMKLGDETQGKVVSVNLSAETGQSKIPVPDITVGETGVAGDAHAGHWHRQVSVLALESIDRFSREHQRRFTPGEFAENITTEGLDLAHCGMLDRFVFPGDEPVELELTQVGKACHGEGCAIFRQVGRCVMPTQGLFCRVIRPGKIKPGDVVVHAARVLQIHVITLSDRASRGVYEDKSGPRICEILDAYFDGRPWRVQIGRKLIPDEADLLKHELTAARSADADVIFTTGSTGIGPRDIAPETVLSLADKQIPGVMEMIRCKYGMDKPGALLSRSVAAVLGQTLIYTLPGSPRAVQEYLDEILKTLEHSLLMLRGIGRH